MKNMDKLTHDEDCPAVNGGTCTCGGPEFVAIGPNVFGFGGTQDEAVKNMKRAAGRRGKVKCVIYRGLAAHNFKVSHLNGAVSYKTQDENGDALPKPERTEYEKGL